LPPASSPSSSLFAQREFVLFWFARVSAMVAHQMLTVRPMA